MEALDGGEPVLNRVLHIEQRARHWNGVLAEGIDRLGWLLPGNVALLPDTYPWARESADALHRMVGGRRV